MTIIAKEERIQIEVKAEQEKEYTLLGSYEPRINGGSIFEYSIVSGEIRKADIIELEEVVVSTEFGDMCESLPNKRIATRVKCLYVEALNKKNAIKRLKKGKIILAT